MALAAVGVVGQEVVEDSQEVWCRRFVCFHAGIADRQLGGRGGFQQMGPPDVVVGMFVSANSDRSPS